MSVFMKIILFCCAVSTSSLFAEENPYDLLSSLSPDAPISDVKADARAPASVDDNQIAIRPTLPEAKQRTTARTLQWEVMHNKKTSSDPMESETELGE